jgi:16S rRNA (cytidine1402-2'-O)-methyltransferase
MTTVVEPGALYIVSTPIGNLDDITHRAVNVLGAVDLIAAEDTRTTRVLLNHLGIKAHMVSHYSYNESHRIPQLIDQLKQGRSVAVVTDAGTPGISDPAFGIIRRAIEEGIRVFPVPGASALLSALVVSGLPTDRFVFEGFLPLKKGRRRVLDRLRGEERTIVLYESPHRLLRTLRDLHEALGDRQAVVARELTKKFEEVVRGTLNTLLNTLGGKNPRGEYVVLVEGAGRATHFPESALDIQKEDGNAEDTDNERSS